MNSEPSIGIVAGMGPRSTGPFVEQLYEACRNIYGAEADAEFPQILICSQPAPFKEQGPQDHEGLQLATSQAVACLHAGGASFVAIACNTVHAYFSEIQKAAQVPLLSIVEVACAKLPAEARVALVAASATAESGIFQARLQGTSRPMVVDAQIQAHADKLLHSVRAGAPAEHLADLWRATEATCVQAGADCVLVACLDLSASLKSAHLRQLPVVDAAEALAEACVREWLRRGGRPWSAERLVNET